MRISEALLAREIQLALIEGPDRRKDLHIEPFMEDHMVLVDPVLMDGSITISR